MKSTAARKLKQVPQGYLVMGVDPHKKKHAAVAITQDFTTLVKFKFDNSREGLRCSTHIRPCFEDARSPKRNLSSVSKTIWLLVQFRSL